MRAHDQRVHSVWRHVWTTGVARIGTNHGFNCWHVVALQMEARPEQAATNTSVLTEAYELFGHTKLFRKCKR